MTKNQSQLPAVHERFDFFDQHYYKVSRPDGVMQYYPSVTTVLQAFPKPQLNRWRAEVGAQQADMLVKQAAETGSAAHELIDHLNKILMTGADVSLSYDPLIPEQLNEHGAIVSDQYKYLYAHRYLQVYKLMRFKVNFSEGWVYSHKYQYAGTADTIVTFPAAAKFKISRSTEIEVEKGKYLADVKTGKSTYEDHYIQLAAYFHALKEMGTRNLKGALLIHLNGQTKTGIEGVSVKVVSARELKEFFNDFLNVKKIWDKYSVSPKPRIFDIANFITTKPEGPAQLSITESEVTK